MLSRHFYWLTFLLAAALSGCASTGSNNGKYFDRDGPPSTVSAWRASSTGTMKIKVEPANKWANRPYKVMGQSFTPMTGDKPFTQTGTASWYGKQFHGKKTAIGEIYDMYAMTAAHPTMELPSYAKVTNLANGRSVIVRVNDRGPFIGGRAIDMSYAAAVKLGYQKKGTTRVKIERITRKQIAADNVPTATHTNVSLAAALAANEVTAKSSTSSAAKTGTLLAAASAVAGVRSSGRTAVVKETVRQSLSFLENQSSEKSASMSAKTASVTQKITAARKTEADTAREIKRIEDTIASYMPQEDTVSVQTADPLASLVPTETQPATVTLSAAADATPTDDTPFDSVFPEEGSVASATSDAAEEKALSTLDSAAPAWGAQIGAFDDKINAQTFAAHTEMMLATENIKEPVRIASSGNRWCILVGSTSQAKAREIARTISDRLGTSAFAAYK